jgi:hypothetical protein
MSGYIVITRTEGDYATLSTKGAACGTSGPMSLADLHRAPEVENPRFAVRAVTMSGGVFVTNSSTEEPAKISTSE